MRKPSDAELDIYIQNHISDAVLHSMTTRELDQLHKNIRRNWGSPGKRENEERKINHKIRRN